MIDITRRGLLGGLFAGTLIASAGANASILTSLPDRYRDLIDARLQCRRLLPAYDAAVTVKGFRYPNVEAVRDTGLNDAMERVVQVLLDRFDGPILDVREAKRMINMFLEGDLKINTLDDRDLRQHEDYLVAIASIRDMLQIDCLPLNGQTVTGWRPFVAKYRDILSHV